MADIINRYAPTDLFMPDHLHRVIREHVGATKTFPRFVDAWWIGFCLGVRGGHHRALPGPDKRVKFMDGTVLSTDPWRIIHLELIALALRGEDILASPRDVIQLANEYAVHGLESIVHALTGQNEPVLALTNFLDPAVV